MLEDQLRQPAAILFSKLLDAVMHQVGRYGHSSLQLLGSDP